MRGGGIVNHFLPHPPLYYEDVVHFLDRQENEPKETKGKSRWTSPLEPQPSDLPVHRPVLPSPSLGEQGSPVPTILFPNLLAPRRAGCLIPPKNAREFVKFLIPHS